MSLSTIVMAAVAGVLILSGIIAWFAIPRRDERAVYARRLLVTMLLAFGGILGFLAWLMAGWEARS